MNVIVTGCAISMAVLTLKTMSSLPVPKHVYVLLNRDCKKLVKGSIIEKCFQQLIMWLVALKCISSVSIVRGVLGVTKSSMREKVANAIARINNIHSLQ